MADQAKLVCRGVDCKATVVRATAWVPAMVTLRKALRRMPKVSDLAQHLHCGKCSAQGRKAGLRFFRHDATVVELERRRTAETARAQERFAHYL